jgi:putative phosphoesterase
LKIAILSDSHDHVPLLRAAGEAAKAYGAEAILHCGDVVAPSTLRKLQEFGLPVHAIHGNNAGDTYMLSHIANKADSVITYYGQDASIQLGGRRIFLVHYPHYANAMALTGEYDFVCCGHTHRHGISRIKTIKGVEAVAFS